jgi:hypothetical protein
MSSTFQPLAVDERETGSGIWYLGVSGRMPGLRTSSLPDLLLSKGDISFKPNSSPPKVSMQIPRIWGLIDVLWTLMTSVDNSLAWAQNEAINENWGCWQRCFYMNIWD